MQTTKVDAIVSAWQKEGEVLAYSQIKKYLVSKEIITKTNDRSLSRWLRKLVGEGILEKTSEGYALVTKPNEYHVFDYLNDLRQKFNKNIYEGEVGEFFSHISALTYLNFDETLVRNSDEKISMNILTVRLAELFSALFYLRNTIIKRRCGLEHLSLPVDVLQETIVGLALRDMHRKDVKDIIKEYTRSLDAESKKTINQLWLANKRQSNNIDNELGDDIFFDILTENVEENKKYLKTVAHLDIDKYDIGQLKDKYVKIERNIQEKHKKELEENNGFSYSKEESELEHTYRMAILTQVVMAVQALETNLEDFAVILTRHPATMNQYYTPEHIFYEAMTWAIKEPEDKLGKEIWREMREEEKSYESMVAEKLMHSARLPPQDYDKLRILPWVKMQLPKYGSFDIILKRYTEKWKKYYRKTKNY
ncbi:MAG: hypothetical protein NWE95_12760 [Candidatus Bathyarchaeota archaeon]|nr:hypothetical protein [Candidatus Bathyarchaeota archaeon]